jgi:hypothetical protein
LLKHAGVKRGCQAAAQGLPGPLQFYKLEQYDFSMNLNYIPAECGFQLQHNVIATVENRQHYLFLYI